jgi:hypothetical protein
MVKGHAGGCMQIQQAKADIADIHCRLMHTSSPIKQKSSAGIPAVDGGPHRHLDS